MKKNQALFTELYSKSLVGLVMLTLFATGCTKSRDAALPDAEVPTVFAISDFGTISETSGFKTNTTQSLKTKSSDSASNKATDEKGYVNIDSDKTEIPERLRFMFNSLEIAGQETQSFKIVFGVDSKYVTAYKATDDISSLTKLEKQIAVSPSEIQMALDLLKTTDTRTATALTLKMSAAQKVRTSALAQNKNQTLLVPLFKYEIKAKGVLERTKNELRESTSVLALRETEFAQATHIKIDNTSDSRKDVGGADQKILLDQLFTNDSIDNKVSTSAELQNRFNIQMKFVKEDSQVFTKLDSVDLKVYELSTESKLTVDELRQLKSGRANGEILRCADQAVVHSKDQACVLRLVATVPVTYTKVRLNLADRKANTTNTLEFTNVTKNDSNGLVSIVRDAPAKRQLPTGVIDPLHTIKISDLKGDFYFRRTFEDASNMLTVGQTGTSGDMAIVNFELQKDRLVIRNQRALIQYAGQTAKDKEEMVSVPVKYFKMETVDTLGTALQVGNLVATTMEEAEYVEIDWTANKIPVANSPLAYYAIGDCFKTQTSQNVTDIDMRLSTDGIMSFSLAGAYSLDFSCANRANVNDAFFSANAQLNYNVTERLSFKRKTDVSEDIQFASGISPTAQNSMNFAIFTLASQKTASDIRAGRVNSEIYKPVIHDFRNGKVLKYWIGGLKDAPAARRDLITAATQEVINEWNESFHRAFKGSDLDRSGDFIQLMTEDNSSRGHLGDLDRNYLWFMDMPAENGLLGVAQPAPNPNSGIIVANNVIVYSGNSEKEVHGFVESYKESRTYEKMLEQAKQIALQDIQTKQAATAAAHASLAGSDLGSAAGNAVNKISEMTSGLSTYTKRLVLSTRSVTIPRMSSMYASYLTKNRPTVTTLSGKQIAGRTVVSDIQINSDKSFTRNVMQQALASEFKDDPIMLEAIIAKELARSEPGMSAETKALLRQQADAKIMSLKFNKAAKKQGGCFLYTNNYYNDKFLASGFDDLFKKEIKATLSHEIGHALGLVHNFKASYDKANFNFEGENTDRNYTSIMDYLASTEMGYHGPGPYDVHALRAIYTNRIELSETAKKTANGGVITGANGTTAKVSDGKYINIEKVGSLLGFTTEADMQKQTVDATGLLKHYGQCNDSQQNDVAGCTAYDSGSSATEIVQAAIRSYNRSYITSYHASDRLNFGIEQKIAVINRSIQTFKKIRQNLDTFVRMLIYKTAINNEELLDFQEASRLGYDFFHNLIRTPDTNLPYGSTPEEIAKRMIKIPFTTKVPRMTTDAKGRSAQAVDKDQNPLFDEVTDVKVLEARRLYDVQASTDRFDTLGITYDKSFALQFLLTANPTGWAGNTGMGWISYNDFERYFLGVKDASQSQNMLTMLEIMSGELKAGFVDDSHNLRQLSNPVELSRDMMDAVSLDSLADTNSYKMEGLDTFAEFFKIGTLKAGGNLNDRLTTPRIGQNSSSAAAIKFYAPDNSQGGNELISRAARKTVLLENKGQLAQLMGQILAADTNQAAKMAELKKKNEASADKKSDPVVPDNAELSALTAVGNEAAAKLVAKLTELNKNEALVRTQEIKSNPNLALDAQVKLLRGMLLSSVGLANYVAAALQSVPEEKFQAVVQVILPILAQQKNGNDELAKIDLLALGQEILSSSMAAQPITLQGGKKIAMSEILGLMMSADKVTSDQKQLMYFIEDLARYTRMLNPEYLN